MSKFSNAEKVGLRNKDTEKLLAVYPHRPEGNDDEIIKKVTDWYYSQNCAAEELMKNSYVDILTDEEIKSWK
ncbi:hypothetical protein [Parasporobacterium paucivorans]|uniref:Uncharacterized protein n=1 Tax=Parasporobacterium paucivorans DSM 15970 TaxID=1122934 RepID=A0A1M6LH92_9FIRM|nr:hypothetical protein [Parasporobacterium paucivorans]SHJ70574.1 hypothetical protein SAMN02745691_02397 [Parasporobacterium paucivorans DSM 15970]